MSQQHRLDLAAIVRRHQRMVWWHVRALGASDVQADDITQETFIALMRSPFTERSDAETAGYLRTIARRLYITTVQRGHNDASLADIEAAEAAWLRFSPSETQGEAFDALDHCLEVLDERPRKAIDLFYRDGLDRAGVGKALGLAENGAIALLQRAKEALRDCMKRRMGS